MSALKTIEVKIAAGDMAHLLDRPIPFLDKNKVQIGMVVDTTYRDGYTYGLVELSLPTESIKADWSDTHNWPIVQIY